MKREDADQIAWLDAHDQAALVKRREVPPTVPIEAAMARIEAIDPKLNAVCHRAFDHAIAAAHNVNLGMPMPGVPYLLKASMEYPGFPAVCGSRSRTGMIGKNKFPFAAALDTAGLVPCGMSTMPEFGLIGSGEALVYGPTRNPWNPAHGSGGSSAGAAVAVASGMVPFATGSDGGGSIRIPAAHCGIIGFKPSRGWNLRARAPSLIDDLLASDALYARTMRDTIWAARTLRSQPAPAPAPKGPLKIALSLTGLDGQQPDAEIAALTTHSAEACAALGHNVEQSEPPIDRQALSQAFDILWSYGAGEVVDMSVARLGDQARELLEPWTLGLGARRDSFAPETLARALSTVGSIEHQMHGFWTEYDVVLSPVTSSAAPRIGMLAPGRAFDDLWRDHFRHVNYTQLQNMAGTPALSLPMHCNAAGLPVGTMYWTKPGSDDLLLALGAEMEQAGLFIGRSPL